MDLNKVDTVTLQPGYVPGLDGIRAIAIGLVLFAHSVIFDQFNHLKQFGHGAGYTGVVVFFVLSGYLITRLLLREEAQSGGISLRHFYLRRALRLFPALWLYLLVIGVIWLAGILPKHPWHSFVTSLFYVRNIVGRGHETNHLWSLSIEEQFYLLWPLVLVCLPHRNRVRLCIATGVIVAVTAWRVYATQAGLATKGTLYIRSDFRFDAPLFGCGLALLERVSPRFVNGSNSSAWRSALLALFGTAGLLAWVVLSLDTAVYPGLDSTVVCLLGVVLILSQVGVQGGGSRWLAWKPLVAIGQISYGLYLWQQLFLGPRVPGLDHIRTFPVGLVATIIVSVISYRFLELPLIRLKDRRFHRDVRTGEHTPKITNI